jgi:hypothetical protein
MAKHRWIIERDYEELKQELGLGHYEGRGCRGFRHHATFMYCSLWVPDRGAEPFFPLLPAPAISDYQPRGPRRTSARAVRRVRPERHNPQCRDRASSAAATTAWPVLRIAARIVVGVYLKVFHATLPSMGFASPGAIEQLHAGA